MSKFIAVTSMRVGRNGSSSQWVDVHPATRTRPTSSELGFLRREHPTTSASRPQRLGEARRFQDCRTAEAVRTLSLRDVQVLVDGFSLVEAR